jgi:hypothetical protein
MLSNRTELICWEILNTVIRITGYWFIFGGIIFIILSVIQLITHSVTIDRAVVILGIALAIVLIILGCLVVRADKFYPKHLKKETRSTLKSGQKAKEL